MSINWLNPAYSNYCFSQPAVYFGKRNIIAHRTQGEQLRLVDSSSGQAVVFEVILVNAACQTVHLRVISAPKESEYKPGSELTLNLYNNDRQPDKLSLKQLGLANDDQKWLTLTKLFESNKARFSLKLPKRLVGDNTIAIVDE